MADMKEIVAGIDIGGTNTVFGLVEKTGRIIAEGRLKTTDYPEVKDFINAVTTALVRLQEDNKGYKLEGDRKSVV